MANYYGLLSSLATDLDNMLSELCTTPPPPYDRLSDNELHNRQTKYGASNTGYGVSHQGSASSGSHQFGGGAYASKNWGSHGVKPDHVGGQVSYGHGGTSAFAGADHTRHQGTDVSAGVRQSVHQGKNFGVDVSGQYGRHYGGPGGTGKASTGVGLNAHGTF